MTELGEEEEEEEEASCSRDHISSFYDVMFMIIWRSCSQFAESCSYFLVRWAVCCCKATNFLD